MGNNFDIEITKHEIGWGDLGVSVEIKKRRNSRIPNFMC